MGSVMASSTTQETTTSSTTRMTKRRPHGKDAATRCARIRVRLRRPLGEHAHHHAELRQSRGELDVDRDQAQVARGVEIGMDGALQQRRGHAGNGDHGQQRHLQAGVEEAARADGQQAQRGKADGVQRVALAVDQPAEQIKRHHPERALHRRGEAGEERVGKGGERW